MEIAESSHGERKKHRGERKKKKKPGSLPLIMFLSMEGEYVHPECTHASNPFHKCNNHCFQKIPGAKSWPRRDISDGGKGSENMLEKTNKVHPDCVYAPNPFHVCVEHCFQRMAHNHKVQGGGQRISKKDHIEREGGKGSDNILVKNNVHPDCIYASNPFHVCAEPCFQRMAQNDKGAGRRIPEKDRAKRGKDDAHTEDRDNVHPMCIYASNPFHTCVDSCFERIAHKDGVRGVVIAKGRKEELKRGEMVDMNPKCKYASNPFHNCSEYCGQGKPGKNQVNRGETAIVEQERNGVVKTIERNADCKGVDADDKCIEYCLSSTAETNLIKGVKSERSDEDMGVTKKEDAQSECVDASNLHYAHAEYSSNRIFEKDKNNECKPQLSPVLPDFISLLIYVIHLIVIAVLYSKRNKVHV